MLKVGLTGGIGSGKSSASRQFQSLGVPLIDADQVARYVVEPGQPALPLIIRAFGDEVCLPNGQLDRNWLRKKIFSDQRARQQLENILHPIIREEIVKKMNEIRGFNYLIADIPLLVEKKYPPLFDRIVVVDCTPEQQIERIQKRDGSDVVLIQGIMDSQASRAERLQAATDVLDNTTSIEALQLQVERLNKHFILLSAQH